MAAALLLSLGPNVHHHVCGCVFQQAEGDAAAIETWWPPVAAALRALGQLYGALDGRTFGGLAQDAVAAATASVQNASRAVAKRECASHIALATRPETLLGVSRPSDFSLPAHR